MSILSFLSKRTLGIDVTEVKVSKEDVMKMNEGLKTTEKEVKEGLKTAGKEVNQALDEAENSIKDFKIKNVKNSIANLFYFHTIKKEFGIVGWIFFLPLIILWRMIQLLGQIFVVLLAMVGCV